VYRLDGSLLSRLEAEGDIQAVEAVGRLVYFGGHDIGPTGWEHVGVVDPVAPAVLDAAFFDEPSTGGDGIWAFHSTGRDLWIGGNVGGPWFGFTRHPATTDLPARTELVPVLSRWRFRDTAAAPAGWTATTFDDSGWLEGPAELGFGDGGEATGLRSGRVTYYFRQSFTVADPTALTDVRLDLLADDGAVAYVNGTEVGRLNMPAGPVTDTTRASSAMSGNAEDTFRSIAVPPGLLTAGTNTIAVEVHQEAVGSSDLSFDARLSAVAGTPVVDATPPTPPTGLSAPSRTAGSVDLQWSPATDDVGVVGYEVLVDDVVVGTTATTTFTVGDLAPSTSYSVRVRALDAAENRSAPSDPLVVTTLAASGDLVALGSTWRYLDTGTAPPAWATPTFDDSVWAQGPAVLGRQEGTEATVLAPGRGTAWFRHRFSVPSAGAVAASGSTSSPTTAPWSCSTGSSWCATTSPPGT
jgi:chitodextrinase